MEMQQKIALLENDISAYYESSQSRMKTNREKILELRRDNKRLLSHVAEAKAGDEHVVKAAFHTRGSEKLVFSNKSGKVALNTLDQKVLLKMKRLNALKHTSQTLLQKLNHVRTAFDRRATNGSGRNESADAHTHKQEEDAMKLRDLENNLQKVQFKHKEAENILTNYLKLRSHMQGESLTFQGQLDRLEAEILKQREEYRGLWVMNNNAQLSKETTKTKLQEHEEQFNKERVERERILASYRRRVDEQKAQAEKVERRTQRSALQADELSSEVQSSATKLTTHEDKSMSTLEETIHDIKEATGVRNIQEIVDCFISQKEVQQQLERLKRDNEKVLQQQKEQKELLLQQFQDIKYCGEDKLSSNQQMLEECEQQLLTQRRRCDDAKESLDTLLKTLSTVRAGMEHLTNKLQHIALSEETMAAVSVESQDFVLQLLIRSELKLQSLQDDLQGKDLAAVLKEMEDEEEMFSVRIEGKLPDYNTRVNPPEDPRLDVLDNEDETEDHDTDLVSREVLKRQSQLIVDSKSKKKPWKKRKGKI